MNERVYRLYSHFDAFPLDFVDPCIVADVKTYLERHGIPVAVKRKPREPGRSVVCAYP